MHEFFGSESVVYFHRCRLKILLPYGPMFLFKMTKEKNKKLKKKKKISLKLWRICTFPQNLALFCFMVFKKMGFTDGRHTDR